MSGDFIGKVLLWGIAYWFFDDLFALIIAIAFFIWLASRGGVS